VYNHKTRAESSRHALKALTTSTDILLTRLEKLRADLSNHEIQLEAEKSALAKNHSDFETVRDEVRVLRTEIRHLDLDREVLRNKIAENERINSSSQHHTLELEKQREKDDFLISRLEREIDTIQTSLGLILIDNRNIELEQNAYLSLQQEAQKSDELLRSEIRALQSRLVSYRLSLDKRVHANQKAHAQIYQSKFVKSKDLQIEIKALNRDIHDVMIKMEMDLMRGFKRFESEASSLNQRMQLAVLQAESLRSSISALDSNISQLIAEKSPIDAEIKTIAHQTTKARENAIKVKSATEAVRKKTMEMISSKAGLDAQLAAQIKLYNEYQTYSRERHMELEKLEPVLERAVESNACEKSHLASLEAIVELSRKELASAEANIERILKSHEKKQKQLDIKRINCDRLRSHVSEKERKMTEAMESNKSSEFSVSLRGKSKGLEIQYESLIQETEKINASLCKSRSHTDQLRQKITNLQSQRDLAVVKHTVYTAQAKRKNFALENLRNDLKNAQKEVTRYDGDLSKVSCLNASFEFRIKGMKDSFASRSLELRGDITDAQISSILDENDSLASNISEISSVIRSSIAQKSNLEAKIAVEVKLSQQNDSIESPLKKEVLSRSILQLKSTLATLNKRKQRRQSQVLNLIQKRDLIEQKRSIKKTPSFRRNRQTTASRSTLASSKSSLSISESDQYEQLREALDEMNEAIQKVKSSRRTSVIKERFMTALRPEETEQFNSDHVDIEQLLSVERVLEECGDSPLTRDLVHWNKFNIRILS